MDNKEIKELEKISKKNTKEKDLTIKEKEIEVANISFKFPITRAEAHAVINRPKGIVAKGLKKYMIAVLEAACKKFLETSTKEDVKNCKINM